MFYDVQCPYCEAKLEINHDDGYGYEEDQCHQQYCDDCEKNFVYTTSISYHYDASKADCLNDGEHEWSPTRTVPKRYTEMRCSTCEERRKPTEEEMEEIIAEAKPEEV